MDLDMDPDIDLDMDMDRTMDLDMDLNMDLSGASPLATVRSAGAYLGPVSDLSGASLPSWQGCDHLGPVWDLPGASPLATVRSAGACLGHVWYQMLILLMASSNL